MEKQIIHLFVFNTLAVNGIATETIGSRLYDRGGGTIVRYSGASTPKCANSGEEQSGGDKYQSSSKWHTQGTRHKPNWPCKMQQ